MGSTFWLNKPGHNKTRSSLYSLSHKNFGDTLKSTMKLSSIMNQDKKNREDKVGVYHFEDWSYMKKNQTTKASGYKNHLQSKTGNSMHVNHKQLKIPQLNTDMMDTIMRGNDNTAENSNLL